MIVNVQVTGITFNDILCNISCIHLLCLDHFDMHITFID